MATLASNTRVGLLGYGRWGALWAKVLAREGCLGWIVDPSYSQRTAAKSDHAGVPVYEELESAGFELPNTHGVIVATPPDTHFDVTRVLLDENQPVLLEKPMTTDAASAQTLSDLARSRSTRLMVDHTFLYAPAVVAALNWIRDRCGPVRYAHYAWLSVSTMREEGAIWNLGPHPISISAELARIRGARATSVSTVSDWTRRRGINDVALAALRMTDGSVETVHLSNFGPEKVREFYVVGEAGSVLCRANEREVLWRPARGQYELWTDKIYGDPADREPLVRILRRFLDPKPLANEYGEAGVEVVGTLRAMESATIREGEAS